MIEQNIKQQLIQEQGGYQQQDYYADDEIDLRELFAVVWSGKWWIILITGLFAVASVFYALSLPNQYKSTAIVAPASESGGGGLSQMAAQFGGLASLAGVNLGSAESNDAVLAMEIMQTWGFQEQFISENNLQVAVFGIKGWSQESDRVVYDKDVYNPESDKWIREAPKGKTIEPTSWELHEVFGSNLSVSQDDSTGLIRVGYTHVSPEYAKKITELLVRDVNALLKDRALAEASENIQYLEEQVSKTALSEMQAVFYSLIQEQLKVKMLAQVSDEYALKLISKPMLPEEKEGPRRAIICIGFILLGGFLGVLFVLLRSFLQKEKNSQS